LPIFFIVMVMWAWKREPVPATAGNTASASPVSIAVLPVRVLGSSDYGYLEEGLVTLLSAELDITGLLEPVDPYLLLSRRDELADGEALSMEQGQELTRYFGAQLFVTGQVVESGDHLRFVATLYRAGDPPEAILRASAEGTDPFSLAASVSRQILEEQLGEPGDRLARAAVRTTTSTVALKSYMEGEQAFRAAEYARAAESFRDALRADPSFALAHYRLSMAAEWSFSFVEARQEAEDAVKSLGALSRRHQQLVRAWHSFITGDADEAEALYEALVAEDPSDVEAWAGVGEVRVHYNPARGRPISDALPAFEKVLDLAPNYGEVRFHRLEFAARDTETARFDSLLAGVDTNSPQRLSWEVARAAAWGTGTEEDAAGRRLAEAEEVVIGIAVARTGVHFRHLRSAEALADILLQPQRPIGWRAAGHIMAAQTLLARGERDLAADHLEAAAGMAPAWVLEMRALAELLPGASPSPDRLRQLRDELVLWEPGRTAHELTFFFATHADVHEQLRLYLLALISVALREDEQSAAYVRSLERAEGTEEDRDFARSLARSAAAHWARATGDFEGALEILEKNDFTPPLERIAVSPFFAGSLDRYLRAELLRELNRTEEALAWYRSLSEGPDILFWSAAAQRQRELVSVR
jgi:tetratricopeptide (TPR) repeat protein